MQWLTSSTRAEDMDEHLRQQFDVEIQRGIQGWENALEDAAQKDKTVVIQDHCFNSAPPEVVREVLGIIDAQDAGPDGGMNVLHLPERLLLAPNVIPLFTIRNPRITVPSTYRTLGRLGLPHGSGRANFSVSTNPIWIRLLYNWYVRHGTVPIVVDCDDIQTSGSTDFLQRLCARLGLDPAALCLSWSRMSDDERAAAHPMFYASQNTLLESGGIDSGLAARNRDLDAEEAAWDEEFGEDVDLVRDMVRQAQVHYAWLLERKF